MSKSKFVDRKNARTDEYNKVLRKSEEEGECPFCFESFFKYSKNPLISTNSDWFLVRNSYSYQEAQFPLLIIPKRHIRDLVDISGEDWEQVKKLIRYAETELGIKGGGLIIRFGDSLFSGATGLHLHFHLIVPKIKNRKAVSVYFPIG